MQYQPMHDSCKIEKDHILTKSFIKAYEDVYKKEPEEFDFWDFGTNAITPVSMGIPTIVFGAGEYKLAHMVNERCQVEKIEEACQIYCNLIKEL